MVIGSRWSLCCCCCSDAKSCLTLCDPWTVACQAPLSPSLSLSLLKLCPLSQWCSVTILSSATPFSFCFHSFSASGSFPMSQLLASSGQSIGASVSESESVLPMNIQGWYPLGLTGLISLLSKRFSRVFSSTTIRKHQFFDPQPSLWSISTVEINVPQFWRIQSPSSSHWQILCMVRIHCLIHRHHLFAIASQGRRNKGVPWGCLS